MRIAIISDIHANVAALRALPERDYDQLWCIGDLVDYGPRPREVIHEIQSRAAVVVSGNHDYAAGFSADPRCSAPYRRLAAETLRYTQEICSDEHLLFLRNLPRSRELAIGETRFYIVHATPTDPLFAYSPEDSDRWAGEVEAIRADVLVVGHTHTPFIRVVGSTTIVNPGSIGQPKTGRPLACYAVWEDGRVSLKEYEYPIAETVADIRKMPIAEEDQKALIAVLETGTLPAKSGSGSVGSPMTHSSPSVVLSHEMENLIAALDSLVDGKAAAERLAAMGPAAIPWLERFLLGGLARTIALPRCRAVHALGDLGAQQVLLSYFRQHRRPADPAVLFAEDAVRSAAAEELAKHQSDEVYGVVLHAAQERITGGLIRALGDFGREESIPVLFSALDDDLCREDARAALRKMPVQARAFAALVLKGRHAASVQMALSLRHRRAVLQLMREFGVNVEDWPILREYLEDADADLVIAVAGIGFTIGAAADYPVMIDMLFRISSHLNWAQEDEVTRLLEGHPEQARAAAHRLYENAVGRGEEPNWLNPRWRILRHFRGDNTRAAKS